MFIAFLVLIYSLKVVNSQQPSPCPRILSYEIRDIQDDKYYGVITLQSNDDLTGTYVNILLDRPAQLLGNWFGETSSADNTEYLIENRKHKAKARRSFTVRFFVKFNRAQVIPSVIGIRYNGRVVCSSTAPSTDQDSIEEVKNSSITVTPSTNAPPPVTETKRSTTPKLNLDPLTDGTTARSTTSRKQSPNLKGLASSGENINLFQDNGLQTTGSLQNTPHTQFSPQGPVNEKKCGVVTMRPSPLITKGYNTSPGQWPWHVSIFNVKELQIIYTCGGTLITEQHVLTAAHCVTKPSTESVVDRENLLIYLGKYTLIGFGPEVQDRDVSSVIVHPEYDSVSYFNDIAVIKLSRPVQITNYVRTCCLWSEDPDLKGVENRLGTVVGWGFDENNKLSNRLLEAQMPVVSTIKCIYSNRDFFLKYTFEKNFCAGFRNGTSVCNGDSGGGLVFPKTRTSGQNAVWQLRGIVSVAVPSRKQNTCDTSQYILFTDVAQYTEWIKQVTSA